MGKSVVEIHPRAVLPTEGGSAVFLGNQVKCFVIYVDSGVGQAISMFMRQTAKARPLTHDLMAHILTSLGAKVERVIINDLKEGTYFARLILSAENELHDRKIVEIDARPSDCIALAVQQNAPIYVVEDVWNQVDDMSEILEKMARSQNTDDDLPDED